jgi:hypothetical protein
MIKRKSIFDRQWRRKPKNKESRGIEIMPINYRESS